MKKLAITLFYFFSCCFAFAQTQATLNTPTAQPSVAKFPELDKSPMDMSYFPADYPKLKTENKTTQPPLIRTIYSRPQKDGRVIFGELVEYDKVWRLGANESTEIEFFKDVVIGGKKVPRGRYTLYAIPSETKWTIIINKDTDSWGAFVYDDKKDLLRTDVAVQKLDSNIEAFSMNFTKTAKGAALSIGWENTSVTLPIDIKDTATAVAKTN